MEELIKRLFAASFSAVTAGALFAVFYNGLSGRYMIGYDYDSTVWIGAAFGLLTTAGLALSGALKKGVKWPRIVVSGVGTGALLYLANVWLSLNAGFTLKGLAIISGYGGFCAAFIALFLWSVFAPLPPRE